MNRRQRRKFGLKVKAFVPTEYLKEEISKISEDKVKSVRFRTVKGREEDTYFCDVNISRVGERNSPLTLQLDEKPDRLTKEALDVIVDVVKSKYEEYLMSLLTDTQLEEYNKLKEDFNKQRLLEKVDKSC